MHTRAYGILAVIITLIVLYLLFRERVRRSEKWRACVTPLASIIGSGFLVSAPLLLDSTGPYATIVMFVIVVTAYALGSSIRFNIRHIESSKKSHKLISKIDSLSEPVLGIAYIISVTFYLKLLSAFLVQGLHIDSKFLENIITTILLLSIGLIGKIKGLTTLEFLEEYSVNTKLSIISASIAVFFLFNIELIANQSWHLTISPNETWLQAFRKVLGLLIIIQGFETSRFLGDAHSSEIRIETMKYAQLISGIIYVVFVAVATVIFQRISTVNETAIISLSNVVTPILPVLLIIAAVMSQFSAAVSDTLGGGGLLSEELKHRISTNSSYLGIALTGICLTWLTDIFKIISIASKAFAIYYAIQLLLSLIELSINKDLHYRTMKFSFYCLLLVLMLLVIFMGIPAE